jgi:SAM-dependent methyltransferase
MPKFESQAIVEDWLANDREKHLIVRAFEQMAVHYGRNPLTGWIGRHELAAMQALIPPAPQPGLTPALDFGCGPGRVTAVLLEKGYCVTGYDISPAMLKLARDAYDGHPRAVFTGDREAINGRWPVIACLGVLDYYPMAVSLWQEWYTLLAVGGTLVVTSPNATSPLAWAYALVSQLSCPAYPASLARLKRETAAANLQITAVCRAFPSQRWLGHTLVLQLQHTAYSGISGRLKSTR